MGYYDDRGKFHTDDEPNAGPGYQDPLYPQPSSEIIPSERLQKRPGIPIDENAPPNPILAGSSRPADPAPAPAPTEGAPQTFALPGAMPMAPARTMETEGTSTTVSGIDRKSKEAIRQAGAKQDLVDAQAAKTAHAAGDVARADAADAAEIARQQQASSEQHAAAQERIIAEGEAAKQKAEQAYQDEYDRFRKMDVRDFFRNDPKGERQAFAAMTVALGGLGTALQQASGVNATNEASSALQRLIQRDFEEQKAGIEKQRDVVGMARGNADRTRADQLHALNLLELKTAAKEDALAKQMASMLAARGADRATIAENQTIQGLARSSAERQARVAEQTANHFQSTTQRRLSEQTGGAAGKGNGATGNEVYDPNTGAVIGMAPTKETAAAANARLVKLKEARENIAGLRQSFEKHGTEYSNIIPGFESDAYKERKRLRDAAAQAFTGPGDHQKDDFERFVRQIGTDKDLINANPTRLDGADAAIRKQFDDTLASVGIKPAIAGRVARGEARPVQQDLPPPNPAEVGMLIVRARQGDPQAQAIIQGMRARGIQF